MYYDLFCSMEESGLLIPTEETHLFALDYVYLIEGRGPSDFYSEIEVKIFPPMFKMKPPTYIKNISL